MRFNEFKDISLDEGPNDPHIFKAVFMAGSPGSGKSTIARMLFGGTGLKTLNVDEFWQLYKKKNKPGDYEKFWDLYTQKEKPLKANKLGLLIDGTGKNPEIMKRIKAELTEQGYECIMVYVNVDLETSVQRAKARARNSDSPDYGREIDDDFIKTTWNRVNAGKADLERIFGDGFYEVDNSGDPNVRPIEKKIRQWLNSPPSNPIAKDWLDQHRNRPISSRPDVKWTRGQNRNSDSSPPKNDPEQSPDQNQ